MATFYKRMGKWGVWIRRSFHKPIHKTFASNLLKLAPETVTTFDPATVAIEGNTLDSVIGGVTSNCRDVVERSTPLLVTDME